MAYTAGNLVNLYSGPQGSGVYHFDAVADDMATVNTAGYFNNTDDNLNLAVDDYIFAVCADGDMILRVSAISSGSVTTQAVNSVQWNGAFGSASATITYGVSECDGTATNFLLPAPYPGARITVHKSGTSDASQVFATDSTGTTLNAAGDRNIGFDAEQENFSLLGISTTRWAIVGGSGFFTN